MKTDYSKYLRHIPDRRDGQPLDEIEPKPPEHLGGGRHRAHFDPGALGWLMGTFDVKTMADVGCGLGAAVEFAREKGVYAWGIDGDVYCLPDIIWDYTTGRLPNPEPVDLVWSMEFLEHVEERYIPNYMPTLQAGRVVAVTHAPPGKGGRHHVNCQTEEYWIDVFAAYGLMFDRDATRRMRAASHMMSIEWDGTLRDTRKPKPFVREHGLVFRHG